MERGHPLITEKVANFMFDTLTAPVLADEFAETATSAGLLDA